MDNNTKVPVHVSIIMDGNGRWARERGQERVFGHKNGIASVRASLKAAAEAGVKYLSLYAFSEENWDRPREEVDYLMKLMFQAISDEMEEMMRNGVRFRVLGNRARLSPVLLDAIVAMEEATRDNTTIDLIIFLSYSGKWDILQAAEKLALEYAGKPQELHDLPVTALDRYLVTAGIPDPDLLIRTSGEMRISNFMLWQTAYTEFLFVDKLWPDFRKEDFREALAEFARRDRRYGKVK